MNQFNINKFSNNKTNYTNIKNKMMIYKPITTRMTLNNNNELRTELYNNEPK